MTSIANNALQDTDSDDSDDELDIFSKLNAMATRAGENAKAKWRGWRRSR